MENSILNRIKSEQGNIELYGSFLGVENGAKKEQAKRWEDWGKTKTNDKGDELEKHKDMLKRYSIAAALELVLGGAGVVTGRGKHYEKFKKAVFDRYNELHSSDAMQRTIQQTQTAYKNVTDTLSDTIMYTFNADKFKDNALLKFSESLGWPGRQLAKFSRASSWFPKKWFAQPRWNNLANYADNKAGVLVKAREDFGQESAEYKALTQLVYDAPFRKLADGFGERSGMIIEESEKLAKNFNRQYFPEGNIFQKKFWQSIGTRWDNMFKKMKNREDFILNEWNANHAGKIENKIEGNIKKTITTLEEMVKDGNKTNLSDESKTVIKKILNLYNGRDGAKTFELDNYAGRVRDLALGGGMTEILLPVLMGGILTKNTMKGETKDEKIDSFIKNGGIGIVGGLGIWMVTMMMALNGPTGMVVSFLAGISFDLAGRIYNKQRKKAKSA